MGVYLIHFDKPFYHARHYIGFVTKDENLECRIKRHLSGHGSKLLRSVAATGIKLQLAHFWPGADQSFERMLKNKKAAPQFCPICRHERSCGEPNKLVKVLGSANSIELRGMD